MAVKNNYNHTLYASYLGYITQAIINNFAPLLFITFQNQYQISLEKIATLVAFNFAIQLLTDLLASKYVDKIGYRPSIVGAHVFAGAGLIAMAILPEIVGDPFVGLLMATAIYAVGGGLIEVLISPIVEACPTDKKESAMSLLHSFYCWGVVFVVLVSTGFFYFVGIKNWKVLTLVWAVIPLLNALYFTRVPIRTLNEGAEGLSFKGLMKNKMFWLIALLMVCAGAAEQAVSQWSSAFVESSLGIPKALGDILGMCVFATLMGTARVLYAKYSDRFSLVHVMLASGSLCIASYLLISLSPLPVLSLVGSALCGFSVGVLWPGTFSFAAGKIKGGGTAMFALLALAGDLGCSSGPALVGFVSSAFQNNLHIGILAAIIFPVMLVGGLLILKKRTPDTVEKGLQGVN